MTSPLFYVDNTPYSQDDCDRIVAPLVGSGPFQSPASCRLAVCLQDTAHWLALCLWLKPLGASVLPIHPGTPRQAAQTLAKETGCSHLLFGDNLRDAAPEPIESSATPVQSKGGELIQLSSGTTGKPKTIARSWRDIDRELSAYVDHFTEAQPLTPVVACPVTHSYGLICGVLAALERGATPHVVTNLNPRFILSQLRSVPEHLLYASPTLVSLLIRILPPSETLHTVMLSGAPLPAPVLNQLRERCQRLCQQYGCSEAGCVALTPNVTTPGLLGTPLPHVTLDAGTSEEQPDDVLITIKGSGQLINTRDLGYFDAHGQLHFLARTDDTINVAGINVYPGAVEDVYLNYPGIREAVAYKQADSFAGERVCLRFVADSELDIDQLKQWSRDHLSPHQVPAFIEQVETIPRLPNGKVSRRLLSEAPAHTLAAEVPA
ncbi:AMP-binding protein [Marinobacter litoralis]|uniref:AMP-binding protein n=1 Tax=Marinobacter litoralis TaxID=187981 RepID=UPI0018ECC71A|nr:AMP-binding protein [Marinobacter litoralis]MBJ6136680.1 AMP-binding protein [Marinobacter litoralis]